MEQPLEKLYKVLNSKCQTFRHVSNTGDIGQFVIIGQKPRGSNVRRIYAVTNSAALESIDNAAKLENELSHALSDFSETFIDAHKLMEVGNLCNSRTFKLQFPTNSVESCTLEQLVPFNT